METKSKQPDTGHEKPEEPGQSSVTILIDGVEKRIHRGNRAVSEIRSLGDIPQEYEIDQLKDGQYVMLPDDGHIVIKGGEEFVKMPRSGGFS